MADLIRIAQLAVTDPAGPAVLGDALIEHDWITDERRSWVMMLCIGVPMVARPPEHLGEAARKTWHAKRRASIAYAAGAWDIYAGHRPDWTRAVLAVIVCEGWAPERKVPSFGSWSPWTLAWRNATERRRVSRAQQRALRTGRPSSPRQSDPHEKGNDT